MEHFLQSLNNIQANYHKEIKDDIVGIKTYLVQQSNKIDLLTKLVQELLQKSQNQIQPQSKSQSNQSNQSKIQNQTQNIQKKQASQAAMYQDLNNISNSLNLNGTVEKQTPMNIQSNSLSRSSRQRPSVAVHQRKSNEINQRMNQQLSQQLNQQMNHQSNNQTMVSQFQNSLSNHGGSNSQLSETFSNNLMNIGDKQVSSNQVQNQVLQAQAQVQSQNQGPGPGPGQNQITNQGQSQNQSNAQTQTISQAQQLQNRISQNQQHSGHGQAQLQMQVPSQIQSQLPNDENLNSSDQLSFNNTNPLSSYIDPVPLPAIPRKFVLDSSLNKQLPPTKKPRIVYNFLSNPTSVKEIYEEFVHGYNGQTPLSEMDYKYGKSWRGNSRSKESKRFQRRKRVCDLVNNGLKKGLDLEKVIELIENFRGEKSLTWIMNGNFPPELAEDVK